MAGRVSRPENQNGERRDLLIGSGLSTWSWRRRWGTLLLIGVVGFGLTIAAFSRARNSERELARSEFEAVAERVIVELSGSLELNQSFLRSLVSFFDASGEVSREEFAAFTSQAFVQPISLQALAWVPKIPSAEREAAEAAAREHFADFAIRERSPSGALVPASSREEYFPVYYAEPLQEAEEALGLDILSDPVRRDALKSAWTIGEPKATKILTLLRTEKEQQGFLTFHPVYERPEVVTESPGEAGNLKGFVAGIVGIDKLTAHALKRLGGEAQTVNIRILDSTDTAEINRLELDKPGLEGVRDQVGQAVVRSMTVAGRSWQVVCLPRADSRVTAAHQGSTVILGVGILVTVLMSSYAFRLMARAARNAEILQRIAHTEELYRRVVETMRDGLVIVDENGLFTYVNDRFCEITGRVREDFIGNAVTKFLDNENRAKVEREFGSSEVQERESYEIRWQLLNGQWISAIVGPSPMFDVRGNFRGSIATLTDVTELKVAENKVRNAMQAKSDFLATISHEMRTPLNGIIGMSRLLLRSGLPVQQREYANLLESSADSLLQLINSILDFSKIEAAKITLEAMSFRIEDSLTEVKAILGPRAAAQGIDLRFEGTTELGDCLGDPLRLRQILLNIVGNAIKFTEDGYVAVSAKRIEALDEKVEFRFTVRDTGIGISEEAQPFIFGSFTQADSSTSRLFGGTGLGLAISKRLVELMGGEIGVRRNPGGGSIFWFTVILDKSLDRSVHSPSKVLAGTSARSRAREGFHILVAEDNSVNRLVALRELEYLGYKATAVGDGTEVLRALQEGHYDLVLMDCQMPKLDGFETTGRIRIGERPGHRLPIVAVTAYTMKDDVNKCLAAGMDDYISKPFDTDQLRQVVDRWLSIQASGSEVGKTAKEVRQSPRGGVNLRALKRLEEIAGEAGADTVEAIVEAFLEQLPVAITDFQALHASEDAAGLGKVAHSLSGASSTIGAFRLAELCRQLEDELQSSGIGGSHGLLEAVYREIETVQESLRRSMKSIGSGAG